MLNELLIAIVLVASCANVEARAPMRDLVPYADWRVTSGKLEPGPDGTLLIREGSVRAELQHNAVAATLEFSYFGPTTHSEPLASGELRRQIGLKLRAQDTCNVVYVMWHIEPAPGIVVSVKSNPGQSRHAECSDRGYTFLRPARSTAAPRIEPGEPHVLGAEVRGSSLIVTA